MQYSHYQSRLVPEVERGKAGNHLSIYVITLDNVAFHHSRAVTAWFDARPRMMSHSLAPYSSFLNLIEELFSVWRWKVFDHCHMTKCLSWMEWMLHAKTSQLNTAKGE